MACAAVYVGVSVLLSTLPSGRAGGGDAAPAEVAAPGDVIIGGIFPVHDAAEKSSGFRPHAQQCVRFNEQGLVRSLAMINAIEKANKSPLLADVNITLGYRIMDSCSDVSTALRVIARFTERSDCRTSNDTSGNTPPVMAVIGATHSEMSIAIARQLTLKMVPQISYSSTAVILSDKQRFPAFLRTIPNDRYQTAAMVTLLKLYGWNWVGIIITEGDYGRSALDSFVSQASEHGICVAFRSILPGSITGPEIRSAISLTARTIYNHPKVNVIVSFSKKAHTHDLFHELKRQALAAADNETSTKRVWVASDSWSSSPSARGNFTLEDIGHVVGFMFKSGDLKSFHQYLSTLPAGGQNYTDNNPFLKEFYMHLNASKGSISKMIRSLAEHTNADRVFSIEMAVRAIAQAVASLCRREDCKTPGAVRPWKLLKVLRGQEFENEGQKYQFDSRGDINLGYDVTMWKSHNGSIHVHNVVAEYHPWNNSFTHKHSSPRLQDLQHIISRCSDKCLPGEFKKTAEGQHTCCYECINCTENYYSNATDMDQCLSCDVATEWAPEGSSSCTPKDTLYFSWQDGFAVVLLSFAATGILVTLLLSALFLHRRHTPVVRAAGGPLCQVILFSLIVSFVSAVLFVGHPNSLQCKVRQVLFGISFTLCVSCILVKTLQILLAFQFNPELQMVLRKLYKPYAIVFVCVALQVVTCSCWLILQSPYNHIISYPTTLLEDCHEGSYLAFGVMLGYIAVLALVCFICAFKGRKLPHQYNEARSITFSMLLYLISWLLFIPVYVTTSGVYLPAVEMVVILISNYGVLSCHFLPKCYVILFKKEKNTKTAFRKTLYEYSSKSAHPVTASQISVPEPKRDGQTTIAANGNASSLAVIRVDLPQVTAVPDNTNTTSCSNLHQGPVTRRQCLRRSTSV